MAGESLFIEVTPCYFLLCRPFPWSRPHPFRCLLKAEALTAKMVGSMREMQDARSQR